MEITKHEGDEQPVEVTSGLKQGLGPFYKEWLEALVDKVQDEWECGGLGHDSMYGEFAIEVAERAVAFERERCAQIAEKVEGPYQIGEGTPCSCGEDIAKRIRA